MFCYDRDNQEVEKLRLESDERRHRLEIEDRKSQRERDVEREKQMFDLFKSLAQTKNNNQKHKH